MAGISSKAAGSIKTNSSLMAVTSYKVRNFLMEVALKPMMQGRGCLILK